METNISRVRSAKDIIISATLIAGGCLCCLFNSIPLSIFGVSMAITGLILILVLKSGYIIDGKQFKRITYNLDKSEKEKVLAYLKGASAFVPENGNGALLFYVYQNRKELSGYARLYEYINYGYQPCSELVRLTETQVSQLVHHT